MGIRRPTPARERSYLVTGGAGFIGSHLTRHLLRAGARVVVADDLSAGYAQSLPLGHSGLSLHPLDVAGPGALAGLVGEEGPFDAIVHLAARVGVARVLADPEGCWEEHLRAARELLVAVAHQPPSSRPRVVAASTSEVYREGRAPLAEDAPLRSTEARGRWAYAASKLAVERLLDASADLWPAGCEPLHLRFFNVVGPGQSAEGGMVLPTFVRQALAGERLTVHGDGRAVRTLAAVEDVAADLTRLLVGDRFPGGPLNVGGSACCTILELAQAVARGAGAAGEVVRFVDPRRSVSPHFEEVRHRRPDLSRARALGLCRARRSVEEIVADLLRRERARTSP